MITSKAVRAALCGGFPRLAVKPFGDILFNHTIKIQKLGKEVETRLRMEGRHLEKEKEGEERGEGLELYHTSFDKNHIVLQFISDVHHMIPICQNSF